MLWNKCTLIILYLQQKMYKNGLRYIICLCIGKCAHVHYSKLTSPCITFFVYCNNPWTCLTAQQCASVNTKYVIIIKFNYNMQYGSDKYDDSPVDHFSIRTHSVPCVHAQSWGGPWNKIVFSNPGRYIPSASLGKQWTDLMLPSMHE